MTGIEVIVEIFFPKVRKMLLAVKDEGQHFTN